MMQENLFRNYWSSNSISTNEILDWRDSEKYYIYNRDKHSSPQEHLNI